MEDPPGVWAGWALTQSHPIPVGVSAWLAVSRTPSWGGLDLHQLGCLPGDVCQACPSRRARARPEQDRRAELRTFKMNEAKPECVCRVQL